MQTIAEKLELKMVPLLETATLDFAVEMVKTGQCRSKIGKDMLAEGVVVRPVVPLLTRSHHRVIGKLKVKDF